MRHWVSEHGEPFVQADPDPLGDAYRLAPSTGWIIAINMMMEKNNAFIYSTPDHLNTIGLARLRAEPGRTISGDSMASPIHLRTASVKTLV